MPIPLIKNKISLFLKRIEFEAKGKIVYSPDNTLKNSIINDPDITSSINGKSDFHVHIKMNEFHNLIRNTFYYNNIRYKKQKEQIKLLEIDINPPWLLTTIYYTSFFSANEISNLTGHYNLSITEEERKKIYRKNISIDDEHAKNFLSNGTTHFYGNAKLLATENTIQITFQGGGGKPHELAWNNLYKIINQKNGSNTTKIRRLQNIIGSNTKWKKPNQIRNEWNYSRPEYYNYEGNIFKPTFELYLNNPGELNKWSNKIKNPVRSNSDDIISVIYLYSILGSVMDEYDAIINP